MYQNINFEWLLGKAQRVLKTFQLFLQLQASKLHPGIVMEIRLLLREHNIAFYFNYLHCKKNT